MTPKGSVKRLRTDIAAERAPTVTYRTTFNCPSILAM